MAANWKPNNWEVLVRGDQCPVCDLIQIPDHKDAHLLPIADLSFSRLCLAKNQFVPGYCVLLCRTHVIEPYDLIADARIQFFDDLAMAGKVLQVAFNADKMNYNILGNVVPHLHVHLIPRYFTDNAPHRPIDPTPTGHEVFLSDAAYAERMLLIQQHLGAGLSAHHWLY
jgi:diadenosine tetraphosphate (Ap4A) HIT family hydrolase